ncbi:MAG TPA: hypothetical protein VK864_00730, partial [Longimicrobiales bacterium]|nr:hypothetical protein [Longimicrobiales bacterium]
VVSPAAHERVRSTSRTFFFKTIEIASSPPPGPIAMAIRATAQRRARVQSVQKPAHETILLNPAESSRGIFERQATTASENAAFVRLFLLHCRARAIPRASRIFVRGDSLRKRGTRSRVGTFRSLTAHA